MGNRDNRDSESDLPNWERTTSPEGDINFRHGLLMREVEDLKARVAFLERIQTRSIRPQQIQTAGISMIVSGIIAGVVQLLNMLHTFGH